MDPWRTRGGSANRNATGGGSHLDARTHERPRGSSPVSLSVATFAQRVPTRYARTPSIDGPSEVTIATGSTVASTTISEDGSGIQRSDMRMDRENGAPAISYAIERVAAVLADDPTITGVELLNELRRQLTQLQEQEDTATCKHCGTPIKRRDSRTPWRHTDPSASRGCRAASFDANSHLGEPAWNDSLSRRWKATPPKGWQANSTSNRSSPD